jgi:uncharacterized protein
MKLILTLAYAILIPAMALSQNEIPAAVKVIANPKDQAITIRWAPTTPAAWQYANQFGYMVERVTLIRNNQRISPIERTMLTNQPIRPRPLADWQADVQQNKYAAMAAQALYGERFQVTQGSSGVMQIVNQAKESEQRFSFALFGADYSPRVAELSGLTLQDRNAKFEEQYLYKVWVSMPDDRYPIDTGYVFVGLKDYRELPVPQTPEIQFMDKTAMISWSYGFHKSTYIAYFIERSDDGGTSFRTLSEDPIVPTENSETPEEKVYVMDTLADNNTVYTYRIKGITAFGETGPVSESVQGKGKKALSAAPAIRNLTVINNEHVKVEWEYPASVLAEITGFTLERSFTPKGPFLPVSPTLSREVKEFTDVGPGPSNYYRIVAQGTDDKTYSFPHLAQLIDSIPPAPPLNVTGKADTLGVVTLNWTPGKEHDLLGYRVYRANFSTMEYSQITVSPVPTPVFRDTINLKTLTKDVHYRVVAVDHHFNPSDFSEPIAVKRPDIMPPAAPAFRNIDYVSGEGIIVQWINSSSTDVRQHLLYRRTTFDNNWRLIGVIPVTDSTMQFTDREVQNKNAYEYTLIAMDENALESLPAKPIRTTVYDRSNKPVVQNFFAKADKENKQILLSWVYSAPNVMQFRIYRKGEDGHLRLYGSVPPDALEFSDRQLTVNNVYQYTIKAVFSDGAHSPFSDPVTIRY